MFQANVFCDEINPSGLDGYKPDKAGKLSRTSGGPR